MADSLCGAASLCEVAMLCEAASKSEAAEMSKAASIYEYKRHRPAPRPWAAPLVPFLAAPRVGRAAVWASVPFGTYQVAGSSQMG